MNYSILCEGCKNDLVHRQDGASTTCPCPCHAKKDEKWKEEIKKMTFWERIAPSERASLTFFCEVLLKQRDEEKEIEHAILCADNEEKTERRVREELLGKIENIRRPIDKSLGYDANRYDLGNNDAVDEIQQLIQGE